MAKPEQDQRVGNEKPVDRDHRESPSPEEEIVRRIVGEVEEPEGGVAGPEDHARDHRDRAHEQVGVDDDEGDHPSLRTWIGQRQGDVGGDARRRRPDPGRVRVRSRRNSVRSQALSSSRSRRCNRDWPRSRITSHSTANAAPTMRISLTRKSSQRALVLGSAAWVTTRAASVGEQQLGGQGARLAVPERSLR